MTDNKAALDAANTEIIKVAAILATGQYNVSEDKDDYSVKVPASVLHLIGKQNERMKTLATRLKNASDVIRKALTTPPAPTVMGDDVREAVDVLLEAYSRYYSDEADFERKIKEATETIMRNLRAATQPPQATDAQGKALEAFEQILDGNFRYQRHYESAVAEVKAALQSPAVPRGLTALIHDADSAVRSAQTFINMSGQKDLNEIENAMAWLNTAKENCIKALALLGGKESQ